MKIDFIIAYVKRNEFGHEYDFVPFTLRWGAFLMTLFMNSFYCYKRVKRNYPIDMSTRQWHTVYNGVKCDYGHLNLSGS